MMMGTVQSGNIAHLQNYKTFNLTVYSDKPKDMKLNGVISIVINFSSKFTLEKTHMSAFSLTWKTYLL